MHMRAAVPLAVTLLASLSLAGCLGVDNMAQLKADLGFAPEPLKVLDPVPRIRASATMASTGQVLAFSAQGSQDPQGLPLAYGWEFGDGARAQGGEATHAWSVGGFYTVRLTARNDAGHAAQDTLLVTITDNRPPTAAIVALLGGKPADHVQIDQDVTFQAQAADPEGGPVALAWDFGDGATAATPSATHRYDRGGAYGVALRATDAQGLSTLAQLRLPVDEVLSEHGQLSLLGASEQRYDLPVADAARAVHAVAQYDAGLGLNDVKIGLADAAGTLVAQQDTPPAIGTQGLVDVVLDVAGSALQGHSPGAWHLIVDRADGVQFDYDLTVRIVY